MDNIVGFCLKYYMNRKLLNTKIYVNIIILHKKHWTFAKKCSII